MTQLVELGQDGEYIGARLGPCSLNVCSSRRRNNCLLSENLADSPPPSASRSIGWRIELGVGGAAGGTEGGFWGAEVELG